MNFEIENKPFLPQRLSALADIYFRTGNFQQNLLQPINTKKPDEIQK